MSSSDNLKELTKLANDSIEQMQKQITIFDKTLDEMVKNCPEAQRPQVEELRALTTKAFNLAKMGKADEAQAIIRSFQNGSKNYKAEI